MSKIFSPSIICDRALPPSAVWMTLLTSAAAHAPVFALVQVNAELQIGLALDVEDADVLDARNGAQPILDLFRQALQLVQVGSEDLDGIIALDARQRLHDVVADVLREVPIDARQLARQLGIHLADQFRFGARPLASAPQPRPPTLAFLDFLPLPGRPQGHEDFDVVEARRIGAVIGSAQHQYDRFNLRIGD